MKTPLGISGQVADVFDEEYDGDVPGQSDFAAMAKKITISEVSWYQIFSFLTSLYPYYVGM